MPLNFTHWSFKWVKQIKRCSFIIVLGFISSYSKYVFVFRLTRQSKMSPWILGNWLTAQEEKSALTSRDFSSNRCLSAPAPIGCDGNMTPGWTRPFSGEIPRHALKLKTLCLAILFHPFLMNLQFNILPFWGQPAGLIITTATQEVTRNSVKSLCGRTSKQVKDF